MTRHHQRWTADEDTVLRELYATHTRRQIADRLGRREGQVRSRCWTLGLNTKVTPWSVNAVIELRRIYEDPFQIEQKLAALCAKHGVSNPHRKAHELGLTDKRRRKVRERKPTRQTSSEEELRALQSLRAKERLARQGHPRGTLGMRHSEETKTKMSRASAERWAAMTTAQRADFTAKQQRALTASGNRNKTRSGTTWKAAWREIGGLRKYYRSRWEANYARYLEWLKGLGKVYEWKHEPDVFWFNGIKRGCVSYLPDFRVHWIDGRVEYHEVKGWMDAESKTKIKRMKKYHPHTVLVVVDGKAYKQLAKSVGGLIIGWE